MRSNEYFEKEMIVNLCRIITVFSVGFCAVMIFSLISTSAFYSWSKVIAVFFSILVIVSAIYLGHTLKERWIKKSNLPWSKLS